MPPPSVIRRITVHDFSAHVLKIHVDTIRRSLYQHIAPIGALVINRGTEPELLCQPVAFLGSASNADHSTAFDFGDLTNDRTNGSRGSRDHHGLTSFRLAKTK
jgi:hypothetical protein